MKHFICFLLLVFMFTEAHAQYYKKSLGLRLGKGSGIYYRHFGTEFNAHEFNLSFKNHGVQANVLFESFLPVKSADNLFLYYGGGAFIGFEEFEEHRKYYPYNPNFEPAYHYHGTKPAFSMGAIALAGIEYRFKAPVVVALDIRPRLSFIGMRRLNLDFFDIGLSFAFIL